MTDQRPSRELDKVILRLPDGLRDRLNARAKANGRSANAEAVMALEAWLAPDRGETRPLAPSADAAGTAMLSMADLLIESMLRSSDAQATLQRLAKWRNELAHQGVLPRYDEPQEEEAERA